MLNLCRNDSENLHILYITTKYFTVFLFSVTMVLDFVSTNFCTEFFFFFF